jgi:hypothetical protein
VATEVPIHLTEDHSPGREDERLRILAAGGNITGGSAGDTRHVLLAECHCQASLLILSSLGSSWLRNAWHDVGKTIVGETLPVCSRQCLENARGTGSFKVFW